MPTRILIRLSLLAGLMAPLYAFALGVGSLEVRSALNQSFEAEIPLISNNPAELIGLTVRIPLQKDFDWAKIERYDFFSKLRFAVQAPPGGPNVLKISSTEPIREPNFTLLLELTWPRGRLLRGFPVQLDPELYVNRRSPPPSLQPAVVPPPVAASPATAPPKSGLPPAPPVSFEGATTYGPIRSGETLTGIANRIRPSTTIKLPEMMAILLAGNPEAFSNGNPNTLRVGAMLKVPTPQALGVQGAPTSSPADQATLASAPPESPPAQLEPGPIPTPPLAPPESASTQSQPTPPVTASLPESLPPATESAPPPVPVSTPPVAEPPPPPATESASPPIAASSSPPSAESAPPPIAASLPPPATESLPPPLPVPTQPLQEIVPQGGIPQATPEPTPAGSASAESTPAGSAPTESAPTESAPTGSASTGSAPAEQSSASSPPATQPEPPPAPSVAPPKPPQVQAPLAIKPPPVPQPEQSDFEWLYNPLLWAAIALILLALVLILRRAAKSKQPPVEMEEPSDITTPEPSPEPDVTEIRTRINELRSARPRLAAADPNTPDPSERAISTGSMPTLPKPIGELLKEIDTGLSDDTTIDRQDPPSPQVRKLETPPLPDTEPPTASVVRSTIDPFQELAPAPKKTSGQSSIDLPSELRLDNLDFDFGDLGLENTARQKPDLPPLELQAAKPSATLDLPPLTALDNAFEPMSVPQPIKPPPVTTPQQFEPDLLLEPLLSVGQQQIDPLSTPPPSQKFEFADVTHDMPVEPLTLDQDLGEIGDQTLDLGKMETGGISTIEGQGASIDYVETKLDLATAYLDMGDQVGARSLLEEVLREGSDTQQQQAKELLRKVS